MLHEKLSEFHGSHLQDIQLPPKRSFGTNKVDFLERMKPEMLFYLQVKILHATALRKTWVKVPQNSIVLKPISSSNYASPSSKRDNSQFALTDA